MASTAATAAAPASGIAAAVTKSRPVGLGATAAGGSSASSASVPCRIGGAMRTWPTTSSPTETWSTPAPTASTTPAASRPSTSGYSCGSIPASTPAATELSKAFRPAAFTRTRTVPSPTSGTGMSDRVGCSPAVGTCRASMTVSSGRSGGKRVGAEPAPQDDDGEHQQDDVDHDQLRLVPAGVGDDGAGPEGDEARPGRRGEDPGGGRGPPGGQPAGGGEPQRAQ